MKFICCSHNKSDERPFDIYTLPDTALHINKRPFFIPDYADPCIQQLHRAVRICRLGKCISPRFAGRYYDAITLCARFEAPTLPPAVGCCFDECLSVGEWLPKDHVTTEVERLDAEARNAIAYASSFFTLRQGDVILLTPEGDGQEAHINQHIEIEYAGHTVLQFNIK